jgi:A/G-specific adenine glycosylase
MPDAINFTQPVQLKRFRRQLLSWYRTNQRALPWRADRDSYRVWVSEIMLQQTRVAAVLEHYKAFLRQFPNVRRLAAADEAQVLAAWSGLGYYRRARMMHRAARALVAEQNGIIPQSSAELRLLPGVGRYTANAIASIAFSEPVAVVDGNVERVLTRMHRKEFTQAFLWDCAQRLLDTEHPGDFNQAMMELGATICVPAVPICGKCPVKQFCSSRERKQLTEKTKETRTRRSGSVIVAQRRDALLLRQRSEDESLMPSMWELPRLSRNSSATPLLRVRHSITTTDWAISVFARRNAPVDVRGQWISLAKVPQLPLTGLTRKILRKLELLP